MVQARPSPASRFLARGSSRLFSTCCAHGEGEHCIVVGSVGGTTNSGMLNRGIYRAVHTVAAAAAGGLCSLHCCPISSHGSLVQIEVTADRSITIVLYCALDCPTIFSWIILSCLIIEPLGPCWTDFKLEEHKVQVVLLLSNPVPSVSSPSLLMLMMIEFWSLYSSVSALYMELLGEDRSPFKTCSSLKHT